MSILLDTGILFAYAYDNDRDHGRATGFMEELLTGRFGTPVVTDLISAELLTLVRVRTNDPRAEEVARSLLPIPHSDIPGLVSLDVGLHAYPRVWDRFALHRERRLSFVDASHLVIMEEHHIDRLATFDKGFEGLVATAP